MEPNRDTRRRLFRRVSSEYQDPLKRGDKTGKYSCERRKRKVGKEREQGFPPERKPGERKNECQNSPRKESRGKEERRRRKSAETYCGEKAKREEKRVSELTPEREPRIGENQRQRRKSKPERERV